MIGVSMWKLQTYSSKVYLHSLSMLVPGKAEWNKGWNERLVIDYIISGDDTETV